MNKFKIGDAVIVKSTIGNTNDVQIVTSFNREFTNFGKNYSEFYTLSGDSSIRYHESCLELWDAKTDHDGGYTKSLKLKIGATYKRLDGETRKITAMNRCYTFSFLDEFNEAYFEDGSHKTSNRYNLIEEISEPILKLEEGKKYSRRDGAIVTIRGFSGYDDFDYCTTKGSSYMKNGNYHVDGRCSDFDLVEVIEETNVKSLKLEIGKSYRRRNGEVRVIVGISKDDSYDYVDNKGSDYLANGRFYTEEIISPEYDLVKEVKDEVRMQEISLNKKYKISNGRLVRIVAIEKDSDFPVIGRIESYVGLWTLSGRHKTDDSLNLIEVNPYEDFNVDDKVLVGDNGIEWYKRHFAGISKGGKAIVFEAGRTSYTSEGNTLARDYCIKWDDRTSDMRIL